MRSEGLRCTLIAGCAPRGSDLIKDPEDNYLTTLPVTIENAIRRKHAEEELRQCRERLEELVRERTAELAKANEQLLAEIAERKRAEEALKASEERYRSLFEGVPVGLYRTTPTGQILDSNLALVHMLDYPDPGSLQAVNVADLYLDPEQRTWWQARMEREGVVRSFETQLRCRDGTVIWVRNSARAVRDADGRVRYYEGALEDITKRRRAEEELRASRERLRRLTQQTVSAQEEERQRLSRALHDEAGQALTALKISLELIQEDLPLESGLLRQRIGDAAALTTTTMEQIRLLAQDLRPPALDAVGLGPTLQGFCRDFAKRTQLSIDYLGLELPMLPEAVNICLYRFLQEALTNVAKHACANQVCVALRHDAETVSLSVEDDGRGFDGQARLSVSGWPMGIGLLGMQERLESLGGRLEIESRPGQGTRLVAHLPAGGTP